MTYTISHGALSDPGRRRINNEDRYLADTDLGLFLVCDGMGGGQAGEVASALAVATIHDHMRSATGIRGLPLLGQPDETVSPVTNRLCSAVRLANEAIYTAAADHVEWSGMGTTVVAALIHGDLLSFAHVGDSRLYLVRHGSMQPLTTDHSWVVEQVRSGLLTEEEAERSPHRNIVTRALGIDRQVDITLGELPLCPNDRLLLCSDGLTRDLRAAGIRENVMAAGDAQAATQRLVTLANSAGGNDNITVVVLAVHEPPHQGIWQRLRQRMPV
jgi:PPM family protein phosphatase